LRNSRLLLLGRLLKQREPENRAIANVGVKYKENTMDNNNWIQQLLVMGVGTTSLVAEKLRETSDQWVREGKVNPEQAKTMVEDMMAKLRADQGNIEQNMERQFRNVLQDLGVPRQSEMDELRGRIDRLERQVRDLENKIWR
jgi:polyhydroxyalkanoate synthesis regulator phasin